MAIEMTAKAKSLVASQGYDPRYGARPLKRVMQGDIQNPLSKMVLSGEILEGDTVIVDAGTNAENPEGAFSFSVRRHA
jgi:ATP-dependent Clp protease ATP-binding subunit ClpA